MFSGCIPAHAAYFSIYELGKAKLVNTPGTCAWVVKAGAIVVALLTKIGTV